MILTEKINPSLYPKVLENVEPNIVVSCVVDSLPKFKWQCTIFVHTLINLAGVEAAKIYIHIIDSDSELEEFLNGYGVNIVFAKRWGDGKFCNKLSQFDTDELSNADFIFLCDCDLAFVSDVRSLCNTYPEKILGKTVDAANPPVAILEKIFKSYELKIPEIVETYAGDSFLTNCNGGFLGIPGKQFARFGKKWRWYAKQLLSDEKVLSALGRWSHHVDQVSFSMALSDPTFPFQALGAAYNTPTHAPGLLPKCLKSLRGKNPQVLHYHSSLNNQGLLEPVGDAIIDSSIDRVNHLIRSKFSNKIFWDFRYSTNPGLGSGIGSRGKIVPLRRKLLELVGVENAGSVLDVGFGDLEVISTFQIDNYSGIEISQECILQAKEKKPEGKYYHYSEREGVEPHDLVICFDVLIHQDSLQAFDNLVDYLIRKTKRRLVVNGFVRDPASASSMVFFYKNIEKMLQSSGAFAHIQSIPLHKNKYIFIADKIDFPATLIWQQHEIKSQPSLFVHIGSPKTGSTALQKFIKNNRHVLENNGVMYPELASEAMNYLAFSLLDTVPELVHQLSVDMNALYENLKFGEHTNVISAEAFFVCSTARYLREALPVRLRLLLPDRYNVKIILYLRRQDDFIVSIYSQYVKLHAHNNFYTKTIDEFIDEYASYLNYYEILNNWSRVFGKENIIVRVYEKKQLKEGDIISDFLSILGLPLTDDYTFFNGNVNPSMRRDEVEFKRLVNALPMDADIKLKVIPKLLQQCVSNRGYFQDQAYLSPQKRLEIISCHAEENQRIAKEFLGREDGGLFLEPLPDIDDPWQPYQGLSKGKIISIYSFIKQQSPDTFSLLVEGIKEGVKSNSKVINSAARQLNDCLEIHFLKDKEH